MTKERFYNEYLVNNKKFDSQRLDLVKKFMDNNLPLDYALNFDLELDRIEVILNLLIDGYDVSYALDKRYDVLQVYSIYKALKAGINDVRIMNPTLSSITIDNIVKVYKKGYDILPILDKTLNNTTIGYVCTFIQWDCVSIDDLDYTTNDKILRMIWHLRGEGCDVSSLLKKDVTLRDAYALYMSYEFKIDESFFKGMSDELIIVMYNERICGEKYNFARYAI